MATLVLSPEVLPNPLVVVDLHALDQGGANKPTRPPAGSVGTQSSPAPVEPVGAAQQ
jgi:hypothetical protein